MKTINKYLTTLVLLSSVAIANNLLVVDTSGSLLGHEKEVQEIVKKYLKKSGKVLAFNSSPYFIKKAEELNFTGGTALSLALEKVKSENVDFLTIITDGLPNNEAKSIEVANELKQQGIKICGVFVSNDSKVPNTFELIADKTFVIKDINKALELCNDSVKNNLLGLEAIHKSVLADKYVF